MSGEEIDEFHGLLHNADSTLLGTIIASCGGHHHVGETLNKRALGLLETTHLIATSSVWEEDTLFDLLNLKVAGE